MQPMVRKLARPSGVSSLSLSRSRTIPARAFTAFSTSAPITPDSVAGRRSYQGQYNKSALLITRIGQSQGPLEPGRPLFCPVPDSCLPDLLRLGPGVAGGGPKLTMRGASTGASTGLLIAAQAAENQCPFPSSSAEACALFQLLTPTGAEWVSTDSSVPGRGGLSAGWSWPRRRRPSHDRVRLGVWCQCQ